VVETSHDGRRGRMEKREDVMESTRDRAVTSVEVPAAASGVNSGLSNQVNQQEQE
jgi:hypothetical protein